MNKLELLTDSGIKEVIKKDNLEVRDALQLIRKHIHSVKGVDCGEIIPPINSQQQFLMQIALESSLGYFKDKFNENK